MDDSDLALEQAIQRLSEPDDSSDSEVGEGDSNSGHSSGSIGERNVHTRGGLVDVPYTKSTSPEHMYDASTSPDEAVSRVSGASGPHMQRMLPAGPAIDLDLNKILKDDRAFVIFRRFLSDQCITRNLNFWLACEHFRGMVQADPKELQKVGSAIYDKFIKQSATQRVTIHDGTRKNIKVNLTLGAHLTPYLFDLAQREVWEIMTKNELRQFLVSEASADIYCITRLEGLQPGNSCIYTPSMANPAYGVCGGGSLQQSGSEDSASMTSFSTDSDAGPRSTCIGFGQLTRPMPIRNALSDTEGSRPRRREKGPFGGAYITKDKPVTKTEFAALVRDRLLAVLEDQEEMRKKVRDMARRDGKGYEEIMSLEWYDLPETFKYLTFDPIQATASSKSNQLRPLSPGGSVLSNSSQQHSHINSLALKEVEDALKDLDITNQVNKKRRSVNPSTSGSSSVLSSANYDSGVGGDTWATSGIVTPASDRLHAYLQRQEMLTSRRPERDIEAQAAAIALISNSPQPESLNPRIRSSMHHSQGERHRGRQQQQGDGQFVRNFAGYKSSGDDSSSCFTMTSQSSTSDLFIPRRHPHTPHMYSAESDDAHHYGGGSNRYHHHPRRPIKYSQLSTPRKSHQLKHTQTAPAPIVEQRTQMPPPQQPRVHRHSGDTLIVYNLDDQPTPYAKRVGGEVTLGIFKEKVFQRNGVYRFFFKNYCEDLGQEIFEEFTDERDILPLVEGKIMGRVEKV